MFIKISSKRSKIVSDNPELDIFFELKSISVFPMIILYNEKKNNLSIFVFIFLQFHMIALILKRLISEWSQWMNNICVEKCAEYYFRPAGRCCLYLMNLLTLDTEQTLCDVPAHISHPCITPASPSPSACSSQWSLIIHWWQQRHIVTTTQNIPVMHLLVKG